jgi:hypothetical protein
MFPGAEIYNVKSRNINALDSLYRCKSVSTGTGNSDRWHCRNYYGSQHSSINREGKTMRLFRLDTSILEEHEELFPSETIGTQLRNFRTNARLSQRDIAERLKYFNINFMSMIEKDHSGIPANRFVDFMDAYEVPHESRLKLYARCYSVHWETLRQLTA